MEPKASLPSVTPQAPQPEKGLEFREKFPVSEGDCPQEPFAHSFTPSLAQHRHRQPHVGNYGALYLFVLPRVNAFHTPLVPEGRGILHAPSKTHPGAAPNTPKHPHPHRAGCPNTSGGRARTALSGGRAASSPRCHRKVAVPSHCRSHSPSRG